MTALKNFQSFFNPTFLFNNKIWNTKMYCPNFGSPFKLSPLIQPLWTMNSLIFLFSDFRFYKTKEHLPWSNDPSNMTVNGCEMLVNKMYLDMHHVPSLWRCRNFENRSRIIWNHFEYTLTEKSLGWGVHYINTQFPVLFPSRFEQSKRNKSTSNTKWKYIVIT